MVLSDSEEEPFLIEDDSVSASEASTHHSNPPTDWESDDEEGDNVIASEPRAVMPRDVSEPSSTVSTCSSWSGFVVVVDNIDKNLRPSFQRVDRGTMSHHHVNSYAVLDRIDLSCLSDVPPVSELDAETVLPTDEDHKVLCDEFRTLVARYVISCLYCNLHLDSVDAVKLTFLFLQFACYGDDL